MSGRIRYRILTAVVATLTSLVAGAQTDGTYSGYSPYSVYGVGNLHGGHSWQSSMGGVGVATRNKRFINTQNPASVTERDSLSFMADFALAGRLSLFSEGDSKGFTTVFNIDNFVISFPLWRKTALMVGLKPYSDIGYKVSQSYYGDGNTGARTFYSAGNGGIYELFIGGGVTLWNRLSLGAQYNYYFGNINKTASLSFDDASFHSVSAGDSLRINASTAKFGLQYEQPLSAKNSITFGATYTLAAPMRGNLIDYSYKNGTMTGRDDKTLTSSSGVSFGSEIGAGISFRNADRLAVEVDYKLKDWRKSGMDSMRGFSNNGESGSFTASMGHSVRAGFEITPGRNDIRYYLRRCTYRAGAYYEQSYYRVDGKSIDAAGITLGMTLPVFRGYNGVSIGMDLGQRGFSGALVKERYFGFNLSMNVFDIWFQKPRYE